MIDIKYLRENPDVVRASQKGRGEDESIVDKVIAIDEVRRAALEKFETLLNTYFNSEKPSIIGLPSVATCAKELNLSANYFGDLIKKSTGKTAQEYVHTKIIEVAKSKLIDANKNVNEIANELGFKYPQHFTRFFKQQVGSTPKEFMNLN